MSTKILRDDEKNFVSVVWEGEIVRRWSFFYMPNRTYLRLSVEMFILNMFYGIQEDKTELLHRKTLLCANINWLGEPVFQTPGWEKQLFGSTSWRKMCIFRFREKNYTRILVFLKLLDPFVPGDWNGRLSTRQSSPNLWWRRTDFFLPGDSEITRAESKVAQKLFSYQNKRVFFLFWSFGSLCLPGELKEITLRISWSKCELNN